MPYAFTLPLLDAALRGMLLALLLLLAAVLGRERPGLAAARVGQALLLGLCLQVISATPAFEAGVPALWQTPFIAVSVANAVLFWVFVQALFDDDFVLRPLHLGAWAAVAGLSALNCSLNCPSPALCWIAPAGLARVLLGLQRLVPLVFSVLALVAALVHWRADLVEGRRQLRGFIVGTGVVYSLVMLAARLGSPRGRLSDLASTLDVAMMLAMMAVVALRLLVLGRMDLFPVAAAALPQAGPAQPVPGHPLPPAAPASRAATTATTDTTDDPAEARLAATLQGLMADEHAYRSEDLTVASLAQRLAVPEYRLRRLINRRLGHRNFITYVNGWRLAEVRAALADPAQRAVPVLTVALDAGFQSIGPFNRAFKTATGLTPTEFRRQRLADS